MKEGIQSIGEKEEMKESKTWQRDTAIGLIRPLKLVGDT